MPSLNLRKTKLVRMISIGFPISSSEMFIPCDFFVLTRQKPYSVNELGTTSVRPGQDPTPIMSCLIQRFDGIIAQERALITNRRKVR